MINLLTPTGARPEAFAKCVEHMQNQTYKGKVRWIIVDDGPEAMETPIIKDWEIVHIRPEPLWEPGQNTQCRNVREGIKHIADGPLIIIEDDDQYAPWWIEKCEERLQDYDLIGEAPSLYRHLNGTEKWMNNKKHASLCATAMKGKVIQELSRITQHYKGIDFNLWKECQRKRYKTKLFPFEGGVIGIKGYPGRPGIGVGHRLR